MAMWGMISALARLRVLALALAIAALAIQSAHAAAHKTVSASLSARWSGKPIAWELQEFMVRSPLGRGPAVLDATSHSSRVKLL